MAKLILLRGLAHNLADSFISVTNHSFINFIEKLERPVKIKFDFVRMKVEPKEFENEVTTSTLVDYKDWINERLRKLGIDPKTIDEILLEISTKHTKEKMITEAKATIKIQGKEFKGKSKISWIKPQSEPLEFKTTKEAFEYFLGRLKP